MKNRKTISMTIALVMTLSLIMGTMPLVAGADAGATPYAVLSEYETDIQEFILTPDPFTIGQDEYLHISITFKKNLDETEELMLFFQPLDNPEGPRIFFYPGYPAGTEFNGAIDPIAWGITAGTYSVCAALHNWESVGGPVFYEMCWIEFREMEPMLIKPVIVDASYMPYDILPGSRNNVYVSFSAVFEEFADLIRASRVKLTIYRLGEDGRENAGEIIADLQHNTSWGDFRATCSSYIYLDSGTFQRGRYEVEADFNPGTAFEGLNVVKVVEIIVADNDSRLAGLSISAGALYPAFDPYVTAYSATVPHDTESIVITATPFDETATVAGAGTQALAVGLNTFPIIVTAENGVATRTYHVTVNRHVAPVSDGIHGLIFSVQEGRFYIDANESGYIEYTDPEYIGQSDKWSWDSQNKVMSLRGFEWSTQSEVALLVPYGDLTMHLSGVNTFTSTGYGRATRGVNVDVNTLTITGDGTLTARGGTTYVYEGSSAGIQCHMLHLTSGTVNAYAGSGYSSYGLTGSMEVTGGTLNAIAEGGAGIYHIGNPMNISGGRVYAYGMTGLYYTNYAFNNYNIINLSGGEMHIVGGSSYGMNLPSMRFNISGGKLTAVGWRGAIASFVPNITAPAYSYWTSGIIDDPGGPGKRFPADGPFVNDEEYRFVRIDATAPVLSGDATLASLSIEVNDGTSIEFDLSSTTITMPLSYNFGFVIIGAVPSDPKATVSGTGYKSLEVGENTFYIVVTAENGNTLTYTLNVPRGAPPVIHEHVEGTGTVTTAPTCQAVGEMTFKCLTCGDTLRTLPIAKLEHVEGAGTITTAPACESKGARSLNCVNCGAFLRAEEIPALGHDWDDGTVTIPPTVAAEGTRTFTCRRCGALRTEAIPKLPGSNTVTVNGVEISITVVNGVALLKPTNAQMTAILRAPGNEIVFDLRGYDAADITVPAAWFKDFDKTITIMTDKGKDSVKTKTLWNNSGKDRLITSRNGKISIKNI